MGKRFSVLKIGLVVACSLALVFTSIGTASAWVPDRPVEFIIPAGAGGGADVMARFISPLVSKYNLSPKPWIVINKSAGAGAEGFMYVKGKQGQREPHHHHPRQPVHDPPGHRGSLQLERPDPGLPARPRLLRPLGQRRVSLQDRPGIYRRRQESAGQIRHGRHRREAGRPDHHGPDGADLRAEVQLRAVQGRRDGGRRARRQARRLDRQQPGRGRQPLEERDAAGPGRDRPATGSTCPTGRASPR